MSRPQHKLQHISPVFITGTLFSGSTLLGHELTARLRDVHYIGEMLNFTKLPGLSHKAAPKPTCMVCNARGGKKCRFLTDSLRSELSYEDIPNIFARTAEVFDSRIIIDGSKYAAWLQRALSQGIAELSPKVLICVRNPFAFAVSHRNRSGEELWQAANAWRDTYIDALRTVNTGGLPTMVVRYEDFMADRTAFIDKIGSFLGTAPRSQADYELLHDCGGNWSASIPAVGTAQLEKTFQKLDKSPDGTGEAARRFVSHSTSYWSSELKPDTRWHQSLGRAEIAQITQTPLLTDLANLLGYNMVEIQALATKNG